MAKTRTYLTSIHGRKVGIDAKNRLIVGQKIVPAANDAGALAVQQGAPAALNATGTLTIADLTAGIVTSTTAAAVTATLPTGTLSDAGADLEIGEAFDWSVINTGGNTFTVQAGTDHTLVGSGAVATVTSGRFRTRKTAANTFITYRI